QFTSLAKEMSLKPEWAGVNIDDANYLLTVFFERNKNKYGQHSRNEQHLYTVIEGVHFQGFADRIDFWPDGLEIIDYKTGFSQIPPIQRNWQLGFYAIACEKFGRVKRVTLDMLRHAKPLEFEIDSQGNARETQVGRMSFNIKEVKKELVQTAKKILDCYEKGF